MLLASGGAARRRSGAAGCKCLERSRSFPSCGTLLGQFLCSLVYVPLAGFCLPAILSLSAAFLHLWFPRSQSCLRGKQGSWRGGGAGGLKERCQVQSCLPFPPLLHRITAGDGGCRKAQSSGGLFKRKCPFPCPFAFSLFTAVGSGGSTEMFVPAQRPDPAQELRALASPSRCLCPGTEPVAHWAEGTAPAWEGARLPTSQQREGPCSPRSTEGPYKPHLTHRHPRELLSRAHGASLCPGD